MCSDKIKEALIYLKKYAYTYVVNKKVITQYYFFKMILNFIRFQIYI